MALVLSGLPVHSFAFRGFPPRKLSGRRKFFAVGQESLHTLIYYESPYRLEAFLKDAIEVFSDRFEMQVTGCRTLYPLNFVIAQLALRWYHVENHSYSGNEKGLL